MAERLPYGAWPSPITAEDVAAGATLLFDPFVVGDEVWWCEQRPAEHGRRTVVRRTTRGEVEDLLPAPWSAQTRVHEYGGASWLPVAVGAAGGFVFANHEDQRVYLARLGEEPVPLTPAPNVPTADRFADFSLTPDGGEVLCVREQHEGRSVRRSIVLISLAGSGVRELVADGDFLAAPTVSPDGRHLAWIRWNHPAMPWDATELRVAALTPDGRVGEPRTLLGGTEESVLQPTWVGANTLFALSDRTGWWNLVRIGLDGDLSPLSPLDAEFANPMWLIGARWYAVLDDGRVAVRYGVGDAGLALLDPATGTLTDLDLPYRSFGSRFMHSGSLRGAGHRFVVIAGNSTTPTAVVEIDVQSATSNTVRSSVPSVPDENLLPHAEPISLQTPTGQVFAIAYPPRNVGFDGLPGQRPPYMVSIHGGPTAHAQPIFDLEIAYLTSRGIGYVDLNHRGSSGYGRAYRNALRGGWGSVDVEDAKAVVPALAEQFGADPDRIVITGRSAGGMTTLAALVTGDVFAAGISEFGIADLEALVEDTHDFESRYVDSLVAPYPAGAETYRDRSPITHVDDLSSPVLLLQGADDPVVPPNQAMMFAKAAAARGLPHALVVYDGEAHGWVKRETIIAATEAKLSFLGQVLGFTPPDVSPIHLASQPDATV